MKIRLVAIVTFIILVGPGVFGLLDSHTREGDAEWIGKIISILMIVVGATLWVILNWVIKFVNRSRKNK